MVKLMDYEANLFWKFVCLKTISLPIFVSLEELLCLYGILCKLQVACLTHDMPFPIIFKGRLPHIKVGGVKTRNKKKFLDTTILYFNHIKNGFLRNTFQTHDGNFKLQTTIS